MDHEKIVPDIAHLGLGFEVLSVKQAYPDETRLEVPVAAFRESCLTLHRLFSSPVMMLFASDEIRTKGSFTLRAVFMDKGRGQWMVVSADVPQGEPCFDSLAKDMHSAILFEREIREMFGIEPKGHPDPRRLHLHNEVWPAGQFPLRKDFKPSPPANFGAYKFSRVEGEGIFEVPVGPVHAGIIGPGHFRFSVAGEPIVQLETRLGFTHRGVEKLFEGRDPAAGLALSERVCGDAAFGHSLAFASACEKILGARAPLQAAYVRGIYLELERLYNHVNDIGGMATDVSFSFPAALASVIKESIHVLNEKLTGSRYLKNANRIAGVASGISGPLKKELLRSLKILRRDFQELVTILNRSVSFMDRVDSTGTLKKKTAEDLGVVGLAGRASGVALDLRKFFPGAYQDVSFKMAMQASGDVLARFRVRVQEWECSCRMIEEFAEKLDGGPIGAAAPLKPGEGLGYAEAWRGPVLYWVQLSESGVIERCKIVDASFHNWPALTYAVLGNIIPDFPLCNKSFDLSYSGNDL
ncbi:MAG: NADH-quinone oxidoreductase subunit C [Candidatus Omnitrophota bacterium]